MKISGITGFAFKGARVDGTTVPGDPKTADVYLKGPKGGIVIDGAKTGSPSKLLKRSQWSAMENGWIAKAVEESTPEAKVRPSVVRQREFASGTLIVPDIATSATVVSVVDEALDAEFDAEFDVAYAARLAELEVARLAAESAPAKGAKS